MDKNAMTIRLAFFVAAGAMTALCVCSQTGLADRYRAQADRVLATHRAALMAQAAVAPTKRRTPM